MPAVYADRALYRAWTGDPASGADAVLDSDLIWASRQLDRELGVAPGMFAPIASTAFHFGGTGTTTLWLRDNAGLQYFLRTITTDSLAIDDDADGSFDDYLWDLSDAWVGGLPDNTEDHSLPYTALELRNWISTAPLSVWPLARRNIQITGTWGFAQTPPEVSRLVVDVVHTARQAGNGGSIGIPSPDGTLIVSNGMWPILQRLKHELSFRMPV